MSYKLRCEVCGILINKENKLIDDYVCDNDLIYHLSCYKIERKVISIFDIAKIFKDTKEGMLKMFNESSLIDISFEQYQQIGIKITFMNEIFKKIKELIE